MFFFKRQNINVLVEECRTTKNAMLIDVREADEYNAGHIPGAVNIPLSVIDKIDIAKEIPMYIYCLRGSRSMSAVSLLKRMGYQNVRSIGGITAYKGQVEIQA